MTIGKVHMTKKYKRYRQKSPLKFDPKSFRVKTASRTTKLIIGCPKGKYKKGRCVVGTRVQSILRKR
jgi:hypothetical protein